MNYKDQMKEWISKHPNATIEDAWEDGYLQCCKNWCNKTK